MPYEYRVHAHTVRTMGHDNLQDWFNEMGAKDWRLVSFHPEIDQPIIFERKIEVNANLRAVQLGKKPEKEELNDETKNEGSV